jgi:hypothetical protein
VDGQKVSGAMSKLTLAIALVLALVAGNAHAQSPTRVEISAGASAQTSSMSFVATREFPYFAERARLNSDHDAGNGLTFDVSALVPIGARLGARLGVTRTVRDSSSAARGSFPHPFFFSADRTGTWTADDLDLYEFGVHISLDVKVVDRDRFGVSLFGGPSFFVFDQGVIENIEVIENYPYDTIDARVVTGSLNGGSTGFHVGLDGGWFFNRHVGIGGVVRYAAARQEDLRIGESQPIALDLGGLQGGGGIRLRF